MRPHSLVLEKADGIKPLGSAISLTGGAIQIWEQLGIDKEMRDIAKPFGALVFMDEDMSSLGDLDFRLSGSSQPKDDPGDAQIVARPDMINVFISRIPRHKIHFNKRVLSTKQDENKVEVRCSDKSVYQGTILVGADGAYSSIRQNMYKELEAIKKLPASDMEPLGYGYDCVVGVTPPLDPEQYAILNDPYCCFEIVLLKELPYSVWYIPLSRNRIGWMVTHDVRDVGSDEERNFRFSEWGHSAALDLCEKVRHVRCPYGGTFGDIIDFTPKNVISKVMLEDKHFTTWSSGRTVILGDACHKMLPFGGQGANMAIASAIELANLIYEIPSNSQDDVDKIFSEFYKNRHSHGVFAVKGSNQSGALMHNKGIAANMLRRAAFRWTPKWVIRMTRSKCNGFLTPLKFLPSKKQGQSSVSSRVSSRASSRKSPTPI
ncbi:hypothetical protein BGW38_004950 [Lunasporangiospora selenospora]|uniref:FAD-binding domain-containing protein n=1 Tax=Lunasporangiospora selenospora TaxID=979761 RepID=A0A9P6FPU0_9FUNG|nr:hypothetical protein BGW38_004950 [Lunasporangiospora selenospora]